MATAIPPYRILCSAHSKKCENHVQQDVGGQDLRESEHAKTRPLTNYSLHGVCMCVCVCARARVRRGGVNNPKLCQNQPRLRNEILGSVIRAVGGKELFWVRGLNIDWA